MEYIYKLSNLITGHIESDIPEEELEELRMLSHFDIQEICRLRNVFLSITGSEEKMNKELFLNIPCIAINPLKDRLRIIFGYETKEFLDFRSFLCGISSFNSPGLREQKLRIAFQMQDIDGDGKISTNDLKEYLKLSMFSNKDDGTSTSEIISEKEIENVISEVFRECSSDPKREFISYGDFQQIVAPTDFQTKLLIPL